MEWKPDGVTKHERVHTIQSILHYSVRLAHFVHPVLDFLFIIILIRHTQHFIRALVQVCVCVCVRWLSIRIQPSCF